MYGLFNRQGVDIHSQTNDVVPLHNRDMDGVVESSMLPLSNADFSEKYKRVRSRD